MGDGKRQHLHRSNIQQRLPSKIKRMFSDFETLMDPSRNHRNYRSTLTKLTPPIILFMPLLLKGEFSSKEFRFQLSFSSSADLTFTHEGNKTYSVDGLVNFEKMVRFLFLCSDQ